MFTSKPSTKKGDVPNTGLEVIKASYGAQNNFQDVTTEVASLVQDGELNFTVSPQALGILDPAPGVTKTFQANIKINGGDPTLLTKDDGQVFMISAPGVQEKKSGPSHVFNMMSTFWYFLVVLFTVYFSMSAYRMGKLGFGSAIFGYIFFALSMVSFGMFGFIGLPVFIFFYSLVYPNAVNIDVLNLPNPV